ncbi:hypothetical protein TEHN7126_1353 [Tetragenococcus halophilus subsp. halophilus]|nr:hypothetical protein TEHN7125_0362 [Tetragenococcus halophilus subsp. halophilus]GBD75654.1 hypothetical protein TEHN7126_1353 [Tetragenococcus halophilus subsp. halophilus]
MFTHHKKIKKFINDYTELSDFTQCKRRAIVIFSSVKEACLDGGIVQTKGNIELMKNVSGEVDNELSVDVPVKWLSLSFLSDRIVNSRLFS